MENAIYSSLRHSPQYVLSLQMTYIARSMQLNHVYSGNDKIAGIALKCCLTVNAPTTLN